MRRTGNSIKPGFVAIMLALGSSAALASGEHEGGHGNNGGDEGGESDGGHGHGNAMMDFDFGKAVSADEADRTVEIVARDSMQFEPPRITVKAGETVAFRVRNAGQLQHSFTLGSPQYHERHDREMMDMPTDELAHHMDDSPNGMVVQPGQTDTLAWKFEKGGPAQFACHIPGHFPAGMKGQLKIE